MPRADQLAANNHIKALLFGVPKGGGKSTIAASFPGPVWVMNYDGGRVTIPPGVDENTIYVRNYPSVDTELWSAATDRWARPKNVGQLLIQDLKDASTCLRAGLPVQLAGEEEPWPVPKTIVLDGFVALGNHIVDWLLGAAGKPDPEDLGIKFWGARLNKMEALLAGVLPFPCHIVICTWAVAETKEGRDDKNRSIQVPTGKLIPDMGGKMDYRGPGKVDTCLYTYSEEGEDKQLHYYVQVRPDRRVDCVGVRGLYGLPPKIEVTLSPRNPSLPFARIWGALYQPEK